MGPPTNVDGEDDCVILGQLNDTASMGPPTNVDGEHRTSATPGIGWILLQWGRRQTSTERWRTSPAIGWSGCRFNGAADKRRRRGQEAEDLRLLFVGASMGPPTNVDGERHRLGAGRGVIGASMGPPTNVDGERP